jgi:type I restriction enzyme S subunit
MIANLQPYAEYRQAGLPWLASIPKHWDMIPNRALMQERRAVVGENAKDHTLLSLTLRGVIARDMVNPKGKFPAQFNTYKVVEPGDFVFCLFDIDETPRGVGLSPLKGMITGAYDVFRPRQIINPRFLYYYYLFVDDGKLMKPFYTGLRKTIQRGVFASLKAPSPPPEEQATMVRFLDYANGRLERAIRAKRKVIALLHEQKQAIIHRAVTRGLDPTVPLKPSGIPWLGDIPQHGRRASVKLIATRIIRVESSPSGATTLHSTMAAYPFMTVSEWKDGREVHHGQRSRL